MGTFSIEHFIWLQGFLLFLGVVYLLSRRSQKGARFKSTKRNSSLTEPIRAEQPHGRIKRRPPLVNDERSLNIFFNYNGHSWEAHEVLGVPAGCSWDLALEACTRIEQANPEETKEFYRAALNAIQTHLEQRTSF